MRFMGWYRDQFKDPFDYNSFGLIPFDSESGALVYIEYLVFGVIDLFLCQSLLMMKTGLTLVTLFLLTGKCLLIALGIVIAINPLHEYLHSIFFPGRQADVYLYWHPFVTTGELIEATKFKQALLAPVVLMGILPLVISLTINFDYSAVAFWFALLEIATCCSDVRVFRRVMFELPKTVSFKLYGTKIYYKENL